MRDAHKYAWGADYRSPMRRRTDRKPNIAALLCGLFVLCMAVFGVLGVVGWIARR